MKSEFHSVINEFQRLLSEYNFKCPKKLWYDDLICLSKHIIDIYYCYIIARVYKHNGSLEVTMWVGVIDRPDDGLKICQQTSRSRLDITQPTMKLFSKNVKAK